jgi:predicted glycoside hydrolase/deacetylase ChbG (UPF0249 family)
MNMPSEPRPIRVIVNADDLGMSGAVNDAVFDLIADARITSATLLTNAPAFEAAARQLPSFPRCSFGVHLNLTQFAPLVGGEDARVLTQGRGTMTRAIESLRHLSPGLLAAAYREWCAQIERALSYGMPISHIDSHNHVHTRPQFFPVLKAVQRRFGIRRVRLAKNLYSSEQPFPPTMRLKKTLFNAALRHGYRTRTTDIFTELLTFGAGAFAAPEDMSVELMTHPGAAYAGPEVELLRSNWLERVGRTVSLISYGQL